MEGIIIKIIPDVEYVSSTQIMTLYAGVPIEQSQIVSIFNLSRKRPVYDNSKNNVNDLTSFNITSSGATFTLTCPYASEFTNLDVFVVTVEDRVNTGVASSFEIVFDDTSDLTTELLTTADALRERSNTGYYLLAVHKPDESTAGDLTINIYNQISFDGITVTDVFLSSVTVAQVSSSATDKCYIIQGIGAGEGTVKLGAKFATDSGAITVNAVIYAI